MNNNTQLLFLVVSFCIGTSLGSFIGVLIDRIPRQEEFIRTPSHCTNCGYQIHWYENIPLVSYIYLRGRCSQCKSQIPIKYFLIELIFGIVAVIVTFLIFVVR
jgi:leader peptidase (prepilin peptidase)/N-methyltransferase